MKISSKQLTNHLKQPLLPFYLVSGDEALIVQEVCEAIRQAAAKAGYHERQRYYTTASFDWQQLLIQSNTGSLFSAQRIIEIQLQNLKLNDAAKSTLQKLTAHPPSNIIFLIISGKLTASLEASSWCKSLQKAGVYIPVWPVTIQELPQWIAQRSKLLGLKITTDAIELITAASEGNLLAAKQTLEKLQLIYPNENLSDEKVIAAISDHSHFTIFDFIDACLVGKKAQVKKILASLQGEGNEPILLLWVLSKELRTLIKLSFELQKNIPIATLFAKYYVRNAQKAVLKNCLQRHNLAQLHGLLQQAAKIDLMIKGIEKGNSWDELLTLALALAGKN